MSEIEPPVNDLCKDPSVPCPPVLTTSVGSTVCNYVSLCRNWHSLAFFVYILMLVAVIVLVWVAQDTTMLSFFNAAVGCTVLMALLILFMFIHWNWFMRGVIPECSWGSGFYFGASASARTRATTKVSAAATAAPAADVAVDTTAAAPADEPVAEAPEAPEAPAGGKSK
jgi:hypothetical protein